LSLGNDHSDASAGKQSAIAEARKYFTGINTRSYFGHRIEGDDGEGGDDTNGKQKSSDAEINDHVLALLAKKQKRRASVESFKSLVGMALNATQRERQS